ncbi:MAG TPA: aldehyde ferredoxin oxidoreductase N-terminal domain-containing protein [Anaeromyxobacteraceae bacterium]|nr:aldehyde ferredoxin oxidoreductase N-terminal domain-containing protein [Anaeromyxobacteraceae bacterium]
MATSYGWAGKILRVDLSAGTCVSYPTNAFPLSDGTVVDMTTYIGGTGIGYRVMANEVPLGTKSWDPVNRVIFGVGPQTGSGSPSSGRTSIISLHPVHTAEPVDMGQMGGHWGPELKYAGYDAIVIQGKSPNPVWLRIQDGTVTLEDASMLWGSGIYFSTNYIVNNMGPEAHVACIGQMGENLVRMAGIFCDRSHRAGVVGSILGSKNLKAIGVRGTGAVNISADKKAWKSLINYYMSLLGCNNQGVVAKNLQPWSEYSPGGTRWSGAPGVLWGAATPVRNLGNCPDVEHPMTDAPTPINKIGLRTQKGYNDFSDEGMKRTVRMDGCHACPIRCHIATDIPNLLNYGISRYNMNTCTGNSGLGVATISNSAGSNPTQNPMLLSQGSNNLEGDYGIWSDYQGFTNAFKWYYKATVPNPLASQTGQPATIPLLQKYLLDSEYKMLRTTALWNSGMSPFGLLDAGDPRWMQFLFPYVAQNTNFANSASGTTYNPTPAAGQAAAPPVNSFGVPVYGTLGYYIGMGPHRLAQGDDTTGFPGWPELQVAMQTGAASTFFREGLQKHHSIETQGNLGAMVNMMQRNRDANNHTLQNFNTNGLPNTVATDPTAGKVAIAQELFTQGQSIFNAPDESAAGKYAWWDGKSAVNTPMCMARAAFAAASMVNMELHNAITQCNYTLPVWASPLKSRKYRGDPSLEGQAFEAITGKKATAFVQAAIGSPAYSPIIGGAPSAPTAQMALETLALRNFTLQRCLTAMKLQLVNPNTTYTLETTPYQVNGVPTYSKYHPYAPIPTSYGVPQLAATGLSGDGNNMRWSHDYAYPWNYNNTTGAGNPPATTNVSGSPTTYLDVMGAGDTEAAKSMVYQQLGWELNSGLPTQTTLKALGLSDMIAKMQAAGITVPA